MILRIQTLSKVKAIPIESREAVSITIEGFLEVASQIVRVKAEKRK